MEGRKHFVLVHGACHGAWCWYKLLSFLKSGGHSITAMDLSGCGVNPKRLDEVDSFSDYMQPLTDFMASLPHDERVTLIGHSYGGLVISLAMEKFPQKIAAGVFISAYMPNYQCPPVTLMNEYFKRTPLESLLDSQFTMDAENKLISASFGPEYLATLLYQKCNAEDLELGKMLVRPTKLFMEDMGKEGVLSEAKYGKVSRVFVVCNEDQVMKEEFQRWMIQNSPPTQVELITEAGHMVMLSKPQQLSQCLLDIAKTYA